MFRRIAIWVAITMIAACTTLPIDEAPPSFKFGLLEGATLTDLKVSVETTDIPARLGTPLAYYGFQMDLPKMEPYSLQTIVFLPAAPTQVRGTLVSKPQDYASGLKSEIKAVRGPIVKGYGFDSGDPLGQYRIHILVNGKVWKEIGFNVRPE